MRRLGATFTAEESLDAAVAVCNLGLENWPTHCAPSKSLV